MHTCYAQIRTWCRWWFLIAQQNTGSRGLVLKWHYFSEEPHCNTHTINFPIVGQIRDSITLLTKIISAVCQGYGKENGRNLFYFNDCVVDNDICWWLIEIILSQEKWGWHCHTVPGNFGWGLIAALQFYWGEVKLVYFSHTVGVLSLIVLYTVTKTPFFSPSIFLKTVFNHKTYILFC